MDAKATGPRKDAIVVLGMHRSGTSAMARVLSLAGCALPSNLMGADKGNSLGHWEPREVQVLNDEVLADLDSGWNDTFGPRQARKKKLPIRRYLDRAREVIARNYAGADLVVLKEPRVSILVDLWRKALEAEGFRVGFVIMVRHPIEIAQSLKSRDGMDQNRALLLWSTYMLASEMKTREERRVFIKFDDLLIHSESVLDRIETSLDVTLPRRTWDSHLDIQEFLNNEQKHHNIRTDDLGLSHFEVVDQFYKYLDAAARGATWNIDASANLDNWLEGLEQVSGPILHKLERDLRTAHSTAQEASNGAEQIQRALLERQSEIERQAQIVSDEARKREEVLRAAVSEIQDQLTRRTGELSQQVTLITQDAEASYSRVKALQIALEEAEQRLAELDVLRESAAVADERARDAQEELATANSRSVAFEAALAEARESTKKREADLIAAHEAAKSRETGLTEQIQQLRTDADKLSARLVIAQSELASLNIECQRLAAERDKSMSEAADERAKNEQLAIQSATALSELRADAQASRRETRQMQEMLDDATRRLGDANVDLAQALRKAQSLEYIQQHADHLERQLTAAQQGLIDLQIERDTSERKLREQLNLATIRLTETAQRLADREAHHLSQVEELRSARISGDAAFVQERERLENALVEAAQQSSTLERRLADANSRAEALAAQAVADQATFDERLGNLRAELEAVSDAAAVLRHQNEVAQTDGQRARQAGKALASELAQTRAAAEQRESEFAAESARLRTALAASERAAQERADDLTPARQSLSASEDEIQQLSAKAAAELDAARRQSAALAQALAEAISRRGQEPRTASIRSRWLALRRLFALSEDG